MSRFEDVLFRKFAIVRGDSDKATVPFTLSMTCGSMWKAIYSYQFLPHAGFTVSKSCKATNGTLVIRNLPSDSVASPTERVHSGDDESSTHLTTENTFTLTQVSDTTAVMEFHMTQDVVHSPPLTITFSYSKATNSWKAAEPKSKVIKCFTVNAPGMGLGPFAWMANTVEIIFTQEGGTQTPHHMQLRLLTGTTCCVGHTMPIVPPDESGRR
jgi:hypothetical protein